MLDIDKVIKDRKFVSHIIFQVLTGKICVRNAITAFPKDIKDDSIKCVWHALVHFEADEDMRKADLEYAKTQDEYLEMLAFILQKGDEIPVNIIQSYKPYYEDAETPQTYTFWQQIKNLFRLTI